MFPGLEVLETTSLNKDSHQEDFYLFLPRKTLNSVLALGSPTSYQQGALIPRMTQTSLRGLELGLKAEVHWNFGVVLKYRKLRQRKLI